MTETNYWLMKHVPTTEFIALMKDGYNLLVTID